MKDSERRRNWKTRVTTKNRREMLKVKCASCRITKTQFWRETDCPLTRRALACLAVSPTQGLNYSLAYLAKGGVDAGRYYSSKPMRDPALQKKAIYYGTRKPQPAIEKVKRELINQVRPNKRYQTDRADLDAAGFDILSAIGKLPTPLPLPQKRLHLA